MIYMKIGRTFLTKKKIYVCKYRYDRMLYNNIYNVKYKLLRDFCKI